MGPVRQVKSWNQFFVNGYNFQTHEYGKHKSTMNYGVCVKSHEEVNYYGILEEVIELVYHGPLEVYKTILFKCNWMDSLSGLNVHEQYKLIEINHSKKYPKYDPFVLSYQVSQVYYAPYPSLSRGRVQWWAVFQTKARSSIETPVDSLFFQEEISDVPSTLCAPNEIPDYDFDGEEEQNEDVMLNDSRDSDNGDEDDSEDDLQVYENLEDFDDDDDDGYVV